MLDGLKPKRRGLRIPVSKNADILAFSGMVLLLDKGKLSALSLDEGRRFLVM